MRNKTSGLERPSKREKKIYRFGNMTYSFITGSILDVSAGLGLLGLLGSRATATGINYLTGPYYEGWRNYLFEKTKTHEKKGRIRKGLVNLLAFNTFQVPVYAVSIAIGSLISEGEINLEKVLGGL